MFKSQIYTQNQCKDVFFNLEYLNKLRYSIFFITKNISHQTFFIIRMEKDVNNVTPIMTAAMACNDKLVHYFTPKVSAEYKIKAYELLFAHFIDANKSEEFELALEYLKLSFVVR